MHTGYRYRSALFCALCLGITTASPVSRAQSSSPPDKTTASAFPSKPIRVVASTLPGGQPDMLARMIGQKISEDWGRAVIIENRAGAGGILAANIVSKATPDGHTLLYALPNFVITPALQANVPYTLKDFEPVVQIGYSTNVLVVTPALGAKTVSELVAAANAQPGKLIFSSSSIGSASHLTGARFTHITGIKVITVAFKGGPDSVIEVLAGRAHWHVGTMAVVLPFVKEGKLVALGVTTPERSPVLPDVPSLSESLAEF
jgi:tripartite-type tricarboxylate transporter receptor subunit TctC